MKERDGNRKTQFRAFFTDCARGFLLIWKTGPRLAVINIVLFLLQAFVPMLSLVVLKNLIDDIIKAGVNLQASVTNLVLFGVLQLAGIIISQLSTHYTSIQQQIVSDKISGEVLDKAIVLDIQYYENPAFYDELHMVQQQSMYRPAQLIAAVNGIIQHIATVLLFSGFMFMVHWSVFMLVLLLGIPLTISRSLNGYHQFQLDKACMPAQRKSADLYRYLTTDIFAKEVRIFQFGKRFIKQFLDIRQFIFTKRKELQLRFMKQSVAIQAFEIIVTVAIYCIIIMRAGTGALSIGGLVIYFQAFQRLQSGLNSLFQSGVSLFQNQLYLREILRYLDTPSVLNTTERTAIPQLSRGITVSNLDFYYPDTNNKVLHDINMHFAPGSITAIAGENGSGKSTLIKLLCRLYQTEPGSIVWGGADIRDIDADIISQNTSVVFQDFGKYYLSIEDNITLGTPADTDKLHDATKRAGIAQKIDGFADGYKTHLGRTFKNGEQLSGGQWQKIAVARAIYKNAKVLILDEPTSAIDPVSEHYIFKNLKENIGDKIIILITHRLYNLKLADHIYVMEDGKVAESGNFDTLLSGDTIFSRIYDKQIV